MQRVAIVALRLPVRVRMRDGQASIVPSVGGVATGLLRVLPPSRRRWIGWSGSTEALDPVATERIQKDLERLRLAAVPLSPNEAAGFHAGYANRVLWPVFHSMPGRLPLRIEAWDQYASANARFANAVLQHSRPDEVIWVHDYQLMLVPHLVRAARPAAPIAFFLHTPFPPADLFRLLPQRRELLEGVLGADQIGFHTADYRSHFVQALRMHLGIPVTGENAMRVRGRMVRLVVAPMGIDVGRMERLADRGAANGAVDSFVGDREMLLLAGVDRLDYTKGIPRRLLAIESLLRRYPQWRGRVALVQIAVPSRGDVAAYQAYAHTTEQLVGRINGEFSTARWTPIRYLNRSFAPSEVAALFRAARVALVTPIRDGMNLVAKEFVASRTDEDGVLVLSEMAGAAAELVEALLVNPYDVDAMADRIHEALKMPARERRARMQALRRRVQQRDIVWWARQLLTGLGRRRVPAPASAEDLQKALDEVVRAPHATLLLDYDGTLVPFVVPPEAALPTRGVRALLRRLSHRPGTATWILSGRDRAFLERAVGNTGVGLVAEHGAWMRRPGQKRWRRLADPTRRTRRWRAEAQRLMRQFEQRTPGARIERKSLGLAWHWRGVSASIGARRAEALAVELRSRLPRSADVLVGDHVIEVRPHGVDKGSTVAALQKMVPEGSAFVAIGDDLTDEDMFRAVDAKAVTIHVGMRTTRARFRVPDVVAVLQLLEHLSRAKATAGRVKGSTAG
ncbi:MAG TPA: bifunctional alpha,alpha-trehalose-phosphate synthase (UDP-forming)/trehalose-phosphatase [Gemmatimonadaceae bacterium]